MRFSCHHESGRTHRPPRTCKASSGLFQTAQPKVRRMYVIRSARRADVGGALLAHLERTAADLGFRAMRLETGVAFRSISRRDSTTASGWLHRLVRRHRWNTDV